MRWFALACLCLIFLYICTMNFKERIKGNLMAGLIIAAVMAVIQLIIYIINQF